MREDYIICNIRVITGLDMPLGLLELEASSISTELSHEIGKVVSPTHWMI